jgi:hypothetical protein
MLSHTESDYNLLRETFKKYIGNDEFDDFEEVFTSKEAVLIWELRLEIQEILTKKKEEK